MWHLTCGDLAGDSVRALLAAREPQARVRVLRDDLAVGPLADIERPPCAERVAFWDALWPDEAGERPDFSGELVGDAEWLAALATSDGSSEGSVAVETAPTSASPRGRASHKSKRCGTGPCGRPRPFPTGLRHSHPRGLRARSAREASTALRTSGLGGERFLTEDRSPVITVWHGDSASEQLLLARVAAALLGQPVALFEVACGTGDSRVARRKAVSMHAPDALAALYRPQAVEPDRQAALAAAWVEQCAANRPIRRWRDGTFHGEDPAAIDAALLAAATPDFAPLARAMAEVMRRCDGFFPTDYFLYWRARELARQGRLTLRGDPRAGYRELEVRRG
ncbi:DUF3658 domain-containing protein [Stutzerimonas azotifigens]|uniref:DUF3658 domain-containing protein n=1 Tax=Stutzerimonas azotifigens TaxID=291995 RepID=UPI0004186472|nr:DUF3658 domain-containing protein [Stutzerimonas azotifigens]